ncbi:hypothetical protein CH063_10871 [Colletotrichum higginsianum]|uniref:Uncharacterized protein n=1 Tax=Colletotrichum higginsianum (strain IMI 349063) TaxID=759273 RepID=H1VJ44_COLHI|nr:hypothetical protein CH063_10871 [Colletotrichum higginsianum]
MSPGSNSTFFSPAVTFFGLSSPPPSQEPPDSSAPPSVILSLPEEIIGAGLLRLLEGRPAGLHDALPRDRYLEVQTGRLALLEKVAQIAAVGGVAVVLDVLTARRVGQAVLEGL